MATGHQYASIPPAVNDFSGITLTNVAAIGGGVGAQLVIDDAVITSKSQAIRAIENILEYVAHDTWPPST